ncbi:Hypothetical protein D9617_8g049240 [Elsinoe fawcettii]|nr:Hypothetical protein D9617_8g049240 [Elsinoe fawcettii]
MPTIDERKEHFAKKRLTFVLAAFIIGVLCSTHPRQYFQDPAHGDRPDGDNKKDKTKKSKKSKKSSQAEEEEWSPSQQVRFEDPPHPRTARMPRRRYSDSEAGSRHPQPRRNNPMDYYQEQ